MTAGAPGDGHRGLALLAVCVALVVLLLPQQFADTIAAVTRWAVARAGPAILWFSSGLLILALGLALSPWGSRRLAASDSATPEFGCWSWSAMLFAAGMGSGLVFWGLAEPLSHFLAPPVSALGNPADALALTYFHWGLHAWAIYAVAGLSIAYFCQRHGMEGSIGAPVVAGLGGRLSSRHRQRVARGLDYIAVVAVLFGVAGSLGNGVDLLTIGLQRPDAVTAVGLLAVLGTAYMVSAWTGLKRGIRILSLLNLLLAALMLVILARLVFSPALGRLLLDSVVSYLRHLPEWSFGLVGTDARWARGWTVVYLLWWIAWTPFVGVFLARISAGRTVRSYLLGVVFIPTLASILWFWIFGGGGILLDQASGTLGEPLNQHYTAPLFAWFGQLAAGELLRWLTLLLLFIFLVTSADSAVYVMAALGHRGTASAAARARGRSLWGALMLLVALPLVVRGDVNLNKQVAIAGAVPFTLVLAAQAASLVRALWRDRSAAPQ